jgi:hypothetical protein
MEVTGGATAQGEVQSEAQTTFRQIDDARRLICGTAKHSAKLPVLLTVGRVTLWRALQT